MATSIQLRRGLSSEWTTANPVLAIAEIGIETDTDQFKVGNGVDRWNDRPYGGIQGPQGIQGVTGYSNLTIVKQAGEAILRTEVVTMSSSSTVMLAHNNTTLNDSIILGMALNDAITGGSVEVLVSGIITDSVFNTFPLNSNIFLDVDGGTTDVKPLKPLSKFTTIVGKSLGNGDVHINTQRPVIL